MTTPTTQPVLFDGTDTEYPTCPACGQRWKVSHLAHQPHAVPVDPPGPDRPTYRVIGCASAITRHPDTGDERVLLSWPCDGHRMTVALLAWDEVLCLSTETGEPCKGGQRPGPYERWLHGRRCSCCNNRGTHYAPRDGRQVPPCRVGLVDQPQLATADDVIDGRARYADTPGGRADRKAMRSSQSPTSGGIDV